MYYRKIPSYFIHFILFMFCLAYHNEALSSSHSTHHNPDERRSKIIISGYDLLYAGKYEEAIAYFNTLDAIEPGSPEGIFFQAFTLEFIMGQYRSQVFDDRLNIALEKTITKAKKAIKINPSARTYMFLGGAYGVKGVRQAILGSWWRTFINGQRANKYLKKAVEIDPTLYDCYYGIGSYNYWASKRLRRFFGFLFKDKSMLGIQQLHLSIEKGIFSPLPSKITLFRIYMEEKWYDKVIKLSKKILNEHPDALYPRWFYGIAFIRTKQWEKAIKNYQKILKLLEPVSIKGPESLIESWYYLGLSYYNLGEYQKAKKLLDKIPRYKGKVNLHLFFYENCINEGGKLLIKINNVLKDDHSVKGTIESNKK